MSNLGAWSGVAVAVASMAACASPVDDESGAASSAQSRASAIDVSASPCRPLVERLLGGGDEAAGMRSIRSLEDVNVMLRSTDVPWPNYPTFLDLDGPAMRIATVSLVTGDTTLFDVATESGAPSVDGVSARVLARSAGRSRVARRIWHAQALLGMELAHSDAIASTRASFHLRDAANAVANPGSLDAVDACFDGRSGMLVDAQGVPRTSLTPPVILRMWTPTYRNPHFAPPVAPDAWTRPGAPGTRHLIVKFQIGSASGGMEDSSANSDYTIHEVPPTVCYETGDATACGTSGPIPARPALLRVANDDDPATDPAALATSWLHWSGGCINLHPDLGGGDSPDFRAFDAKTAEARAEGKPVYAVVTYPGLDERRLLKDARTSSLSTLGDGLAGGHSPRWYGAIR